jgi:hypothetical protein
MRYLLIVALLAGCGSKSAVPPRDGGVTDLATALNTDAFFYQCDVQAQTGCQPGQYCAAVLFDGNPANQCVPVVQNPIPEGGNCQPILLGDGFTVADFCAPGTTCAAVGSSLVCRRFCFTHRDCPNGGVCAAATNSPTTKASQFGPQPIAACVYGVDCDPVAQTGCPDGTRCMFSASDEVGRVLLCLKASGLSPPEATCQASSQCAPGVICAGLGFCRQICYQQPPDGGLGACTQGTCMEFQGSTAKYGRCE